MSNNTVPAADTGLPNLNRRSALAKLGLGLAASSTLAVAPAVAAPESAVSPELLRLIEEHRAANNVYLQALALLNEAERAVFDGKRPHEAIDSANEEVNAQSDPESEAAMALCAYRCSTIEEARIKAA
jgi:hypothetical protein